ncbi:chondroadherin-like [Ptychodera flava]|uniref:chondroadherin-like n=1 Tax=Ptychodera flava TaxID=63121 RepID=UPI00396A25E2
MEGPRAHILVILLEIYLVSVARTGACPSTCACFGTTADCRNRGLTEIPPDIPPSVTILRLSGNRFAYLGNNSFGGLTNIRVLRLELSSIESIAEEAFIGLYQLQELNLHTNKLETLPASVFDGLQRLKYLYLQVNRLRYLPADLFNGLSELQTLNIGKNEISSIPSELFNATGNLKYFYFYFNQITSLPVTLFHGVSELISLHLYGNFLTELPEGVFDGLIKLRYLLLHQNSLTSLPQNIFDGLSELQILRLYSNNLASLSVDIFNDLRNLEELDLYANILTHLPGTIFDGLTNLRMLRMYNNPWVCDCRLHGIRSWLDDNSESLDLGLSRTNCLSPDHLADRSLLTLPMEDLVCASPPAIYVPRISINASNGDDVIFECNATGVPAPFVNWLLPCGDIISGNVSEFRECSQNAAFLPEIGRLQLSSVTSDDEGTYYCAAINSEGISIGVRTLEIVSIAYASSSSPDVSSDKATSTIRPTVLEIERSQTSQLNVSSIVAFIIGFISASLVCVISCAIIRHSCACKAPRPAEDAGQQCNEGFSTELCDVSQHERENRSLTSQSANTFHGQYEDIENRYICQKEANTESGYVNRHVIQELETGYTSLCPETSPKNIYEKVV